MHAILAATYGHAQGEVARARQALKANDPAAARAAVENVAAAVGQIGTEGDNAVAGVRKRLLQGGHHANAEGEKQGIYDEGYVVVTKAAKQAFLDSSKALAMLAREPQGRGPGRGMEEGRGRLEPNTSRPGSRRRGRRPRRPSLAPACRRCRRRPRRPAARRFRFVDVAARAGLTRVLEAGRPGKDHLLDSAGAGAAFLDFDKDGRLDVYLVNGWRLDGDRVVERGRNALYRQRAGRHLRGRDRPRRRGRRGGVGLRASFVADYDNDGWPDILVTSFGRNVLYRNRGDGRFENVAARAGLEAPGWNTGGGLLRRRRRRLARPLHRALRGRHDRGRPQGQAHAVVARPRAGRLRALRPQGRSRPFLPQREGPLRGGHGSGGHEGPGPRLRLRGARRRLRRRRATRPLRGQRLRSQLPLSQRGQRPLQGDRRHVLLRLRRQRNGPGQHGGRPRRRGRGRDPGPVRHEFLGGLRDPLQGPRPRLLRRRAARPASGP